MSENQEKGSGDQKQQLRPGEKPTLKTLSRLSGLAVTTVSRALADAPDIGTKTKQKVRKIADEVGYIPNRAGVRLRTGKTNVIALILGAEAEMMNHVGQLISAVTEELRSTPYHLIVMLRLPGEDPMRAVRYIVETGSADGIILNQTEAKDERISYLINKRFPFATHGRTEWMAEHPYFDYDNEEFAKQAVGYLISRGRKNIHFILPPRNHYYSQHLSNGAQFAADSAGVEMHFSDDVTSNSPTDEIRQHVAHVLQNAPDTDAIICASPSSAMASVSSAEAIGKTVGEDIDVMAKEAIRFLKEFRGGIITTPEDIQKAGRFLAGAVLQSIRNPEKPALQGLEVPENKFL